jgi:hypothetical protein
LKYTDVQIPPHSPQGAKHPWSFVLQWSWNQSLAGMEEWLKIVLSFACFFSDTCLAQNGILNLSTALVTTELLDTQVSSGPVEAHQGLPSGSYILQHSPAPPLHMLVWLMQVRRGCSDTWAQGHVLLSLA